MHEETSSSPSILIVGASRGLGYAMAEQFLKQGWDVVGTVRGSGRTDLHALADVYPGRLAVESADLTDDDQLVRLRDRLAPRQFDILFVNAGTANPNQEETIADIAPDEFVRMMLTNALGPMRAIETLGPLVTEKGLLGIMSSGQGSIANNEKGGHEVYRGTKAALNMYMRSYAARHAKGQRSLLLLAPGWIRTDLGGQGAPFSLEEAIPDIVHTVIAKQGKPGLQYLDRFGQTVPW